MKPERGVARPWSFQNELCGFSFSGSCLKVQIIGWNQGQGMPKDLIKFCYFSAKVHAIMRLTGEFGSKTETVGDLHPRFWIFS